jgi:hypothetical protein
VALFWKETQDRRLAFKSHRIFETIWSLGPVPSKPFGRGPYLPNAALGTDAIGHAKYSIRNRAHNLTAHFRDDTWLCLNGCVNF